MCPLRILCMTLFRAVWTKEADLWTTEKMKIVHSHKRPPFTVNLRATQTNVLSKTQMMRRPRRSSLWDSALPATKTTWEPTGRVECPSFVSMERCSSGILWRCWLSLWVWVASCVRTTVRWCWSGGARGWRRQGGSWTSPEVTQSQRWSY